MTTLPHLGGESPGGTPLDPEAAGWPPWLLLRPEADRGRGRERLARVEEEETPLKEKLSLYRQFTQFSSLVLYRYFLLAVHNSFPSNRELSQTLRSVFYNRLLLLGLCVFVMCKYVCTACMLVLLGRRKILGYVYMPPVSS